MKAFWIDAGYHQYVEEYIDEWARHETGWFGGLVYAESAAQAKHLFIKDNNDDHRNPEFEYTDKMSIRVLATSTDEVWQAGCEDFDDPSEGVESPWMRGNLSKFGAAQYQQYLGWVKELAASE